MTAFRSFLPILRALALAAAAALVLPAAAHAEWDAGVRAGYYSDTEEAFLGVEALTNVGASGWYFNPNLEFVFVDPGELFTLNGDFHYDFWSDGDWNAWAGAGPALIFRENRRGDDETDFGVNVIAGLGARRGAVRPYVQGKVLIADETEAVLGVGVRFF